MSRTNTLAMRRRPSRIGRAMFVLLTCLNLGLMPCALLASAERACPGCPEPAREGHGAAHRHEHSPAPATETKHDHASGCTNAGTDCCGAAAIAKSDRAQQPAKYADVEFQAPAPPPTGVAATVVVQREMAQATGPPVSPSARRLHAKFCVYLD